MVITFFDFETTGTEPAQCDILTGHFKTLDLGTYELIEQLSITSKLFCWSEEAAKIHGITRDEASNFEEPEIATRKMLLYAKKYKDGVFCCHANASMFGRLGYFDWQVLRLRAFYESDKCYFWFYEQFRKTKVISTHTIAKKLIHLPNYSLGNVASHFDYSFNAHNAEEDVNACIHIFKRLRESYHGDIVDIGDGISYTDDKQEIKGDLI
jgi:DNA polymerase III epsilon subunit-like protein